MKKRFIVVAVMLTALFASVAINGQSADPARTIRRQYSSINRNATKYRKVKRELSGFSAEGGHLIAYLNGTSIMKISATFYGEMGRATDEYYYWNDKLIFAFRKRSYYNAPLSGKIARITHDRFYFKDDKLIRWIGEDGKQVAPTKPEFAEKEAEYLASSKQFVAGARSSNPTIEEGP